MWPFEGKSSPPLIRVGSWSVVSDPLCLTQVRTGRIDNSALESAAFEQGEDILMLRLGAEGEFPILDLGYYGAPRQFILRFQVDDDWTDPKAESRYAQWSEALKALQKSIDDTEVWNHLKINEKTNENH